MKVISYSLSFDIPVKINFIYLKSYQNDLLKNLPDYLFDGNSIQCRDSFWSYPIDYTKYDKIIYILTPFMNYKIYSNIDFTKTLIIILNVIIFYIDSR